MQAAPLDRFQWGCSSGSRAAVAPSRSVVGWSGSLALSGLRRDDDSATVATATLDAYADDVVRHLDRNHIASVALV